MWYEVEIRVSHVARTPDLGEHVLLFLNDAPHVTGPVVSQQVSDGSLTMRYSTKARSAREAEDAACDVTARAMVSADIRQAVFHTAVTPEAPAPRHPPTAP